MRIVIDTDPGNGIPGANTDDGLAIALAAAAPSLSLEGISVVSGNTSRTEGMAVAQWLCEQLKLNIPIHCGQDYRQLPQVQRWVETAKDKRSSDLAQSLWRSPQLDTDPAACADSDAVDWLAETVLASPGEITIIAIGPLSNIAAMLRKHPESAHAVARIMVMGGAFDKQRFPVDTNFLLAPDDAATVISSGVPVTLLPMDVTTTTMLTHHDLDNLERLDNSLTRALIPTLRPWVIFSSTTRKIPGMWIHDALTVAMLIDPSLGSSVSTDVAVVLTDDEENGRTVKLDDAQDKARVSPESYSGTIEVVTEIDNARLLTLLADQFSQW